MFECSFRGNGVNELLAVVRVKGACLQLVAYACGEYSTNLQVEPYDACVVYRVAHVDFTSTGLYVDG